MEPDVSIVIPTFNRALLLPQAIDSALVQRGPAFEVLVLDDASTDATAGVMRRYAADARVRHLRNERNVGIAANRNRGVRAARGRYVAMLDSDDVWLAPDKLRLQVDLLERAPRCALVGTGATIIDARGEATGRIRNAASDRWIRRTFFIKNPFVQSSVLIRKSALAAVGGYDEALPLWEDYELWLRLGLRFELANLRQPLTGYRIHDGNISLSSRQASLAAFRAILDRHGASYPWRGALRLKILRERWRLARASRHEGGR